MPITPSEEEELKEKWENEARRSKERDVIGQTSNKPYVIISLIMTFIAIAAIIALDIFSPQEKDNSGTIALIVGLSATFTGTMFTLLKNQETHVMINNRLSQWMESNSRAERAEGNKEGRDIANARTDKLADQSVRNSVAALPEISNEQEK